jgi:hypothetical protein
MPMVEHKKMPRDMKMEVKVGPQQIHNSAIILPDPPNKWG